MSIFGWSYPPGCNGTPYDEDYPCEVCGGYDTIGGKGKNQCVCPECKVCGEVGNPDCYLPVDSKNEFHHGQVMTEEQERMAKEMERIFHAQESLSYD